MPTGDEPIPPSDWRVIVENAPIVSVDLVVEHDDGVLLGKRENEPAKGEWFVPGGTVLKNETRTAAVHRVAEKELGQAVTIDECLGTYEHFYDTSDIEDINSKHYLATAYRCHFKGDSGDFCADDQHSAIEVFYPPFDDLHPYVQRYLDNL